MSDFQVEKDVPIPEGRQGRESKYPFREMEVGDSFLVAPEVDELLGEQEDFAKVRGRVSNVAYKYGKEHDKKFTVRQVEEGIRVWRVE